MNCTCKEPKEGFGGLYSKCNNCGKPISTPTEGSMEERFAKLFMWERRPEGKLPYLEFDLMKAGNVGALLSFITQEKERSYSEGFKAAIEKVRKLHELPFDYVKAEYGDYDKALTRIEAARSPKP